ncbi:MAG: hypothetical protein H0V45_08045 [Actinobacteria bacterium]|nr:hypothetical protein [Actinomycetota bacterium]
MDEIWDSIADEAAAESPLWADALLPNHERQLVAVFSRLAPEQYALALESIYEGYLLHYGRPRLFEPPDDDAALLLGDYLYAHGLVRVAALGDVEAVAALAELISTCAHLRAEREQRDGEEWVSAARRLGGAPDPAGVERALTLHAARMA